MNRRVSHFTYLLALTAVSAFAQTAGEGAITGVISDAGGAVVPAAKVLITNPAKGIRRELATSGAGIFNAPSLTPGPGYSVEITKEGFAPYEVKDIDVRVGEAVALRATLSVAGAATQVQVVAEAPVIENAKTDTSQLVDTRQIEDLPINGRRVDSFVLLTPGVTADAAFGLLTFRGNPGGNTFLTDGIDTTNQYYDENAGRTRSYNISQDAIQEFQVISSNFLAEYGHATGGVINTVTRSGTNNIHGTAYWFFRNRTLNATDPTANGINPQDWRHQAGASVGGPIKKNKLFYFFNGELERRFAPIVNSNVNNTYFDSHGNYVPGSAASPNCGAPATAAQCTAAINYLSGRVAPGLVPRKVDNNLLFGKLDYQITDRHRLTMEMNYVDFRSPNGIQTSTAYTNGSANGNNGDTNVFDRTIKVGLTSVITPSMINELRYGFFKDRQYDPASPTLLPSIGPVGLTVGSLTNVGYATSYPRLLPSELRNQVTDTISLTYGRHTLKFGFDYGHVEDYVYTLPNQFGSYTYPSLTAFAQDFSGNTTGAKNWTRFTQTIGNPIIDLNFNDVSWFVQDEFHITPKLTITPGLRYEFTAIPQPTQVNPAFPQTGRIPETKKNFAPRFGLAYSVDDKTVFRAGYGMFYNRYVSAAIEGLFVNNGLYQPGYTLNNNVAAQLAAGPVFPGRLAGVPNVSGAASIDYADSSYRNAYSEQANFAIERQIAHQTSLTVSYVWSRGVHLTSGYDGNAAAPTQSYTYAILDASQNQVGSYTTPIYTTRINPAFGKVMVLTSNANTYYNGLIVQLQKRYSGWFQAQASYTWSHAIDDNIAGAAGGPAGQNGVLFAPSFPTSVFNGDEHGEKGSSSNDQRHRLVVNGVFSPKFTHGNTFADKYLINGWMLSVISTFASSYPLPPTINVTSAPGTAQLGTGVALLSTSTLNGLGGSTRVPFESISALNVAPVYKTDARISKEFNIREKVKIGLAFEAANVFNHYILQGGTPRNAQQYTTTAYKGGIALLPYPFFGAPTQTQAPSTQDGTTARRAQAAIRIVF